MKLHDLRPAPGSHKAKRRVGRGIAAGQGKTAGRGTKGQKARAGGSIPAWFEGGQTPLHQRIPKLRGFKNPFKVEYEVVNIGDIARLAELGELEAARCPARPRSKARRADHRQPGDPAGRGARSAARPADEGPRRRRAVDRAVRRRRRVQRVAPARRSRRPAERCRSSRSRRSAGRRWASRAEAGRPRPRPTSKPAPEAPRPRRRPRPAPKPERRGRAPRLDGRVRARGRRARGASRQQPQAADAEATSDAEPIDATASKPPRAGHADDAAEATGRRARCGGDPRQGAEAASPAQAKAAKPDTDA